MVTLRWGQPLRFHKGCNVIRPTLLHWVCGRLLYPPIMIDPSIRLWIHQHSFCHISTYFMVLCVCVSVFCLQNRFWKSAIKHALCNCLRPLTLILAIHSPWLWQSKAMSKALPGLPRVNSLVLPLRYTWAVLPWLAVLLASWDREPTGSSAPKSMRELCSHTVARFYVSHCPYVFDLSATVIPLKSFCWYQYLFFVISTKT